MSKPREFRVWFDDRPGVKSLFQINPDVNHIEGEFIVREVSPTEPDWRKLCEELSVALESARVRLETSRQDIVVGYYGNLKEKLSNGSESARTALAKYRAAIEGEKK